MAESLRELGGAVPRATYLAVRDAEDQRSGALLGVITASADEVFTKQLKRDGINSAIVAGQAIPGVFFASGELAVINIAIGESLIAVNVAHNFKALSRATAASLTRTADETIDDQREEFGTLRLRRLLSACGFGAMGVIDFATMMSVSSSTQRLGAGLMLLANAGVALRQGQDVVPISLAQRDVLDSQETLAAGAPDTQRALNNFRVQDERFRQRLSVFGDELASGIGTAPGHEAARFKQRFGPPPLFEMELGSLQWVYAGYLTIRKSEEHGIKQRIATRMQLGKLRREVTDSQSMGL